MKAKLLAMALAANDRPFTRWGELIGKEQDAYVRKARRIIAHLAEYEPAARAMLKELVQ